MNGHKCSTREAKKTNKNVFLIGKGKKGEASKGSFCWKPADRQPGPAEQQCIALAWGSRGPCKSRWAPDCADARVTYSSSVWDSSSSSLNHFYLFPLSANLQNCACWTTYVWLCLKPVLWDSLDFKNLGWMVPSECALKGRMGQIKVCIPQAVGARRKRMSRTWLCF